MSNFKDKAQQLFVGRDYQKALFNFSLALKKSPKDKEARLGAILSDLAMDNEDEAQALFDYYSIIKTQNQQEAVEIIEEIIESLDGGANALSSIIVKALEYKNDNVDGIAYEDFKLLLNNGRSFSELFESIMFSTKVIISNKNDFFEFIESLLRYGYKEMALNYIESASNVYSYDENFRKLLDKVKS
jgi:tetratricopeptide (TPR) repeat protein